LITMAGLGLNNWGRNSVDKTGLITTIHDKSETHKNHTSPIISYGKGQFNHMK
jgi:hypothetical protein